MDDSPCIEENIRHCPPYCLSAACLSWPMQGWKVRVTWQGSILPSQGALSWTADIGPQRFCLLEPIWDQLIAAEHLLLLEQGDLRGLHAEEVVLLQQLLRERMRVPGGHDRQRQLRVPSRLGLQRQYGLYVHLCVAHCSSGNVCCPLPCTLPSGSGNPDTKGNELVPHHLAFRG